MYTPLIFAVFTLVIAWVISGFVTGKLIPFLKKKQFQQYVREEGPQSHLKKTGTPSMGGIAIITGAVVSALLVNLANGTLTHQTLVPMIVMVLFALIGFIDDYEKAIKKNNLGLNPKQKIIMQLTFSLAFAVYAAYFSGGISGLKTARNACTGILRPLRIIRKPTRRTAMRMNAVEGAICAGTR